MFKSDIIQFVEKVNIDPLKSAIVLVTNEKEENFFIEGDQITLAAALVLVAREHPDFKAMLLTAAAYFVEEGGENGL